MFWSEIRSGVRGRLESGIQKIFCWYNPESCALESRIQLKESIILPAIGIKIQVPLTRNPESRVLNSESTTWNPQSKTVLDYLTSVGQHSFGTSNISPAANHSSFILYKLVITIYMPKGQGSIYIPGTFSGEERLTQVTSEDNPRDSLVASQNVSYSAGVVFLLRAEDLSFFYIQRRENPSVSQ